MKKFEVKTSFIFEGVFFVRAENKQKAAQSIKDSCGLVIGGNIHSSLCDEDIDWNFVVHPEKKIKSIKMITKKMKAKKVMS